MASDWIRRIQLPSAGASCAECSRERGEDGLDDDVAAIGAGGKFDGSDADVAREVLNAPVEVAVEIRRCELREVAGSSPLIAQR